MTLAFIIFCSTVIALFYIYGKIRLSYWKRKSIDHVPTGVLNAIYTFFYNPTPLVIHYQQIYNQLNGLKYGGCYKGSQPVLVIRDPELIKAVLIEDFDHFRNRGSVNYNEYDRTSHVLFSLPGNPLWRIIRQNSTKLYTSSKLKSAFPDVNQFADEYRRKLGEPMANDGSFDVQLFAQNYALDIVATTAFGLRLKNLTHSVSYFRKMLHLVSLNSIRPLINRVIHEWFPSLVPYNLISPRSKPVRDFLYGMIHTVNRYRTENKITNNDVFQILMNLHTNSEIAECKNNQLKFTIDHIAGGMFLAFIAGSHPLSLVVGTALLELAMNKGIQKKLQHEIDQNISQNNGEITFEMLKKMSYLDRVVRESLRKYPPLAYISRVCTKPYRLPDCDKMIDVGTEVIIPVGGLFFDEKYFTNAETFDPDRFDGNENQRRHKSVFIPFGDGPRVCIGNRFAFMNIKVCLIHLLKHYDFEPTPSTVYPIDFARNVFFTKLVQPIVLKCVEK